MNKLRLSDLEKCFEEAKNSNAKYIGVLIETRGSEGAELIVNPSENFDKKLGYYKSAYNENLVLKTFDGIRIVGFSYSNSLSELESNLL